MIFFNMVSNSVLLGISERESAAISLCNFPQTHGFTIVVAKIKKCT